MKWLALMSGVCALFASSPAWATFSIVACDATRTCGAAVATNNLAVGASVIYARAGVGALATQFETNPNYGPAGLDQMQAGGSARVVLQRLLDTDNDFDGQDVSYRQVGLVAATGSGVAYTGEEALASGWAGTIVGEGYSVQGNGLVGPEVLAAMQDAFLSTTGPLAERLMRALEAGEKSGGQSTGRMSAALLVRTPEGGWQDVDLRIDAHSTPVPELRRLFGLRQANDALVAAERALRAGDHARAMDRIADAARLGFGWDRVWRRIARLQMRMGESEAALTALGAFAGLNAAWARQETTDPIYDPIRSDPSFQAISG
jgi:uncharacterized Ntn-hydrolase superfamily protein